MHYWHLVRLSATYLTAHLKMPNFPLNFAAGMFLPLRLDAQSGVEKQSRCSLLGWRWFWPTTFFSCSFGTGSAQTRPDPAGLAKTNRRPRRPSIMAVILNGPSFRDGQQLPINQLMVDVQMVSYFELEIPSLHEPSREDMTAYIKRPANICLRSGELRIVFKLCVEKEKKVWIILHLFFLKKKGSLANCKRIQISLFSVAWKRNGIVHQMQMLNAYCACFGPRG